MFVRQGYFLHLQKQCLSSEKDLRLIPCVIIFIIIGSNGDDGGNSSGGSSSEAIRHRRTTSSQVQLVTASIMILVEAATVIPCDYFHHSLQEQCTQTT